MHHTGDEVSSIKILGDLIVCGMNFGTIIVWDIKSET